MIFGILAAGVSLLGAAASTACAVISSSSVALATAGIIKSGFAAACSLAKASTLSFLKPAIGIIGGKLGDLGPFTAQWVFEQVIKTLFKLTINKEERADELGYRLDEAEKHDDWKKPDDFDKYEEYCEYLKEQIPEEKINKEKLEENKYYYKSVAVEKLAEEASKKYGIDLQPDFWGEVGRSVMEDKEIEAIIAAYKSLGFDNVAINDYFQGKLSPTENEKIRLALLASLKSAYPQKSEKELLSRLIVMEHCSTDDTYMVEHSYHQALNDIKEKKEASEYLR